MSQTRHRATALTVVALASLVLAGCSSSSDGAGGGGKKIALLLPESQTTRYESFDRPLFEAKVKALCSDCQIIYKNANGDKGNQQDQFEAALSQQVDAIVLDPVDSQSAGLLVDKAKQKSIPVVAYDRLIPNADIDTYVSFDNVKVGHLQAQSLVDKLEQDGVTSGNIVMINGDKADNNALLFNQGAHQVLDSSGFTIVPSEDYWSEWKPDHAQAFMEGQIARLGAKGFVGVYAANDGTAGGAIAAMRSKGVNPIPPTTGQDAEIAAIQRIITGEQYMTVYKRIKPEAEAAAQMAVDLANGRKPKTDTTVNNGTKDVPSVLLEPIAVTKDNVKETIFADKFYTPAQVCTGEFATACQALGIG